MSACNNYARPKGVMGGPCLNCGASQPEHVKPERKQDNGSGVLQIGTNEMHEVVVNLPRGMTGHIIFSPMQARGLADTLIRKSQEAEAEPVDRSKQCTTTGEPVAKVRAEQTETTGQHKAYVVLCEEERAKGFVRPYRDRYQHDKCGSVTTMGRALSETYARDPKFYGATFCCVCNAHLPVEEFTWSKDGERVGS